MKLPTGHNLRDLQNLTDEQVQHEYDLCYEILHGVYIDGALIIEGMLHQDPAVVGNEEEFKIAVRVWQIRLDRATDELMERSLLS